VNPDGHPATLRASHPANANAVRSGVYSRTGRVLEPAARELAEEILSLPHAADLDWIGALEISRLAVLIERIDAQLADSGVVGRGNRDRLGLLKVRLAASRRLQEWLGAFGMTPRARAEFARELAAGETLADALRRRRDEAGR